jgi:hypothetical protein
MAIKTVVVAIKYDTDSMSYADIETAIDESGADCELIEER